MIVNAKLYRELKAEQKRLQAELDKINVELEPINALLKNVTPDGELVSEATIREMPPKSRSATAASAMVLEALEYAKEGTATDVLKIFQELNPEYSDREKALNAVKLHLSKMNKDGIIYGSKIPGKNSFWYKFINKEDAVNH